MVISKSEYGEAGDPEHAGEGPPRRHHHQNNHHHHHNHQRQNSNSSSSSEGEIEMQEHKKHHRPVVPHLHLHPQSHHEPVRPAVHSRSNSSNSDSSSSSSSSSSRNNSTSASPHSGKKHKGGGGGGGHNHQGHFRHEEQPHHHNDHKQDMKRIKKHRKKKKCFRVCLIACFACFALLICCLGILLLLLAASLSFVGYTYFQLFRNAPWDAQPNFELSSSTAFALKTQHSVATNVPISSLLWIGSHNSYECKSYGLGYQLFPRQYFNMSQQLDMGIRMLEFDLHFVNNSYFNDSLVLCHGASENIQLPWDQICPWLGPVCSFFGVGVGSGDTGCSSESLTFRNGLAEVNDWLKSNPDEFVIIKIEDNLAADEYSSSFWNLMNSQIASVFNNDTVFTPADLADNGNVWPSLDELRNDNKRLLLYNQTRSQPSQPVDPAAYLFVHDSIPAFEYPLTPVNNFKPYPICGYVDKNNNTVSAPRLFTHFFEDALVIKSLATGTLYDGSTSTGVITPEISTQLLECGFSGVMDYVTAEKMKQFIWTFDMADDFNGTDSNLCAALNVTTGRWVALDCSLATNNYAFACKSNVGTWFLTSSRGIWTAYSCPILHSFSTPVLPHDNARLLRLAALAQEPLVWLSYNNRGGSWSATP